MSGRRFTRPRTKMYDCNYSLGQDYYKSAIDGLDRKYGKLPAETIEPARRPPVPEGSERPLSMGDLDSLIEARGGGLRGAVAAFAREVEAEAAESAARVSRARAREAPPTPEADFENAYVARREEVKKRFSDKMLDAVGINSSALAEESASLRQRRSHRLSQLEEKTTKLPMAKWSAMVDHPEDAVDEWAAKSRAQLSRARLQDIENEMEEMAVRGAQRERRLANLRELLNSDSLEEQQQLHNSSQLRMRKTVITSTTEKRVH